MAIRPIDANALLMCGNYCENEGDGCYIEGEKYHCENFKWRGPQKED